MELRHNQLIDIVLVENIIDDVSGDVWLGEITGCYP